MTAQHPIAAKPDSPVPGRVSQIYAILEIVDQMAQPGDDAMSAPDEARLEAAYARASGIAKRSFDDMASDAARAASGGAHVLLGKGEAAAGAAGRLAHHLREGLVHLGEVVGL